VKQDTHTRTHARTPENINCYHCKQAATYRFYSALDEQNTSLTSVTFCSSLPYLYLIQYNEHNSGLQECRILILLSSATIIEN